MNAKLEDLMYHAGLTANGCYNAMDEYDRKAIEKFAELIVQECISCSTFIGITTRNTGLGPQPIRYTSMVSDKIRKHFGVEE